MTNLYIFLRNLIKQRVEHKMTLINLRDRPIESILWSLLSLELFHYVFRRHYLGSILEKKELERAETKDLMFLSRQKTHRMSWPILSVSRLRREDDFSWELYERPFLFLLFSQATFPCLGFRFPIILSQRLILTTFANGLYFFLSLRLNFLLLWNPTILGKTA